MLDTQLERRDVDESLTGIAAVIFAIVTAGVIAFQLALALGAPWGAYAMGGKFPGRYPVKLRIGAVAQGALLSVIALIVLSRAGLVLPDMTSSLPSLIWLPVAFSTVSLVLNSITPSVSERKIWVPVAVVMLVSSLLVALTA